MTVVVGLHASWTRRTFSPWTSNRCVQVEAGDGASSCVLQVVEHAKRVPEFFTCTSGELLWGQMHTVIGGCTAAGVDTALGPEATVPSGTILSSHFQFRVPARKGAWKVEAAFVDMLNNGQPYHIGFVCHHLDVDGVEVLRRAAETAMGSTGKIGALEIVSVGRYDWNGSCGPGCEVISQTVTGKAVDPEENYDDEPYYRSLVYGRFMLVDAHELASLIQGMKDGEKIERKNYMLRRNKSDTNFGTHLVVDDSEYDMGWMAFQNGELVGFVYGGAYSGLEGDNLSFGSGEVTAQ